jgi:hypothetical protein
MANPTIWTIFRANDKVSGTVQKMNRSVTGFSRNTQSRFRSIGSSISRFRGLITGAAALITSGAIANTVNKYAEAGDEIAKTSRRIGLSAEALQELRFAADRSGIASETFTKSLERLNRNVGDLRVGTGTLTTFLNKSDQALAEQLKNVESNEEAFSLLVNKIATIENPMDRAALAQAAFGRAGQEILILAEQGTEGLESLREEARRYGNIISGEAANRSEQFVDTMTNMKAAMLSIRNQALNPLIERLTPLIQKVTEYVVQNKEIISSKIIQTFQTIGKVLGVIKTLLPFIIGGFAAYLAITKAIVAVQFVMMVFKMVQAIKAASSAQAVFNIIMTANPIGAIIVGITALIAIIVLLVKNWDKVVAQLKRVWDWFLKLLDNPFFSLAASLVAPFITIPAMIIKHWEPIKKFFVGIWNAIEPVFEAVGKIGNIFKGNTELKARSDLREQAELVSSNRGQIMRERGLRDRSRVDVNLNNIPAGSSVQSRGRMRGVSLNTSFQEARL